jgi:hypothetical protein
MISTTTAIWRRQQIATQFTGGIAIAFLAVAAIFAASSAFSANPPALFTSGPPDQNQQCSGINLNIYGDANDVYVNGGPTNGGSGFSPDGSYCIRVTDPSGNTQYGHDGNVDIVNGGFATCYQLEQLTSFAEAIDANTLPAEFKVQLSSDCSFDSNTIKSDNFKLKSITGPPPPTSTLCVHKFYDKNANGVLDSGEVEITGWKYQVFELSDLQFTRYTPNCNTVDPDMYTVVEGEPTGTTSWIHTGSELSYDGGNTLTPQASATSVDVDLTTAGTQGDVYFGNVCLGSGGGLTLGFWSNKNGQAKYGSDDNTLLASLNLRNANGSNFDPAGYSAFKNWLLSATATNMAYMLSAQLAAMELNVYNGFVSGTALVYAPCLKNYGATSDFISITALMDAANSELGLHGLTKDGSPYRAYQECLKNALDDANNNKNFVEDSPCPLPNFN